MFRRKKSATPEESPGPGLREQALTVTAEDLGLRKEAVGPVWGVVMDTRWEDGSWFTIVTFADGATSLYTSGAFGIIGAGEHAPVRHAADNLRTLIAASLGSFHPAVDTALPSPGWVTIRALTFEGPVVLAAPEQDLGEGRHPESGIFHSAHEVIGQMRMAAERSGPGRS